MTVYLNGVDTHEALTTGVHGVGSDYLAKAADSQYTAVNRAGDMGLGALFKRLGEDNYISLHGGFDNAGAFYMGGKNYAPLPGGVWAEVPNAAKDALLIAFRFSGATDTPEMVVGRIPKARIPDFAHKADHENIGGDEISVAGLSGLLADSQTPLAHTHTKHTNRSRALPLIPFVHGTGEAGNAGTFDVYTLDAPTEYGRANFQIPEGGAGPLTVIIGIIPAVTGTFDWTVEAEQLDGGEMVGTDTDTSTADGQAATHNQLLELDISAAFDGLTLVAGDWVGVKFTLDALDTTVGARLVGLSVSMEMDE